MEILPFVRQYWERLGVDKVVVYDNGSNDGSIEYGYLRYLIKTLHMVHALLIEFMA